MPLTRPRAHQFQDSDYKQSVRLVSDTNITLSSGAPATLDGASLAVGDRILVTGQSTGSQNGLYQVSVVGSGSNGTWVRTADGDATGDITAGMVTYVESGSTYADTEWKLTTDNPITLDTTALTFEQKSSGGTPGGSDTQIQFNDGGSFGGDSGFTYNKTTDSVTISGGVQADLLTVNGNVLNGQSDGVGNIGNATVGFDTVHAKATSSQYADLAEKYQSDKKYPAGTVVAIGGKKEITQTTMLNDPTQIGVISVKPAIKMNDSIKGQYVAFTGRVPVRVIGKVKKGDMIISSATPGCAVGLGDHEYVPGAVIGKALDEYTGQGEGVIEVIIGRY